MKLRKTIAFLTAVAMLAALVPAMALTASAADVTAIILSDGRTAYKLAGSNLIADGSFETDEWEAQLTTGSSHGVNGIDYTSAMNEDISGVWTRSSQAKTGSYSLALASDSYNGAAINDANKPASIKHYIQNTTEANQLYYVSFYAKSADDSSEMFSFAAESVNHISGITSVEDITVGPDWTFVERVVEVEPGEYLLINIYNMFADSLYLDDFAVYQIYSDNDTRTFYSAMSGWRFNYSDGDVINSDLDLPTSRNTDLSIVWTSDRPEILTETGEFTAPFEDTSVTLTASFALSGSDFYAERSYRLVAEGFGEAMEAALAAQIPRVVMEDITLPATVTGFDDSEIISWSSADTSVITNDGVYTAPEEQSMVYLTATVSYNGLTVELDIPVIVGVQESLIENGSFEEPLEGNVIPGWTVGVANRDSMSGTTPMTTNYFAYETEDDGSNSYIVSTGHAALTDPRSIRTYVELPAENRIYNLSFDVRYMGTGTSEEQYIAAYVVNSTGSENQYDASLGGINYAGDSIAGLTYEDGWQTYTTQITTNSTQHYLMIAAKWLNRNSSTDGNTSNSDGRWAFDNFILTEVPVDFYGDVTISYYDRETGEPLKNSRTERNVIGNTVYTATAADKTDIIVDGVTYGYDDTSVDSVTVSAEENEIRLYFMKEIPSDVTIQFLSRETGEVLADETTVEGFVGFTMTADDDYKSTIIIDDTVYLYDTSSVDTITVSEDADENVITLYFKTGFRDSRNLIPNGDFATGDTTGWTNRTGGTISGATISMDSTLGVNALSMATGGRTDPNNIGTIWNVTPGKTYYISFYVGGSKPSSNNYVYNRLSDSYNVTDNVRENAGTDLIRFGELMTGGQWNHMEHIFTAQTDTLYIQSSWVDNIQFANFVLNEYMADSDFTTSVTINYLDRATGQPLKEANVVTGINGYDDGSSTYTADTLDKADITVDGTTYFYDTTSTDTVVVRPDGNVINLYFIELAAEEIEAVSVDALPDEEVTLPETVVVTYNNGTEEEVSVTWDAVPALTEGESYTVNGTLENGLTTEAIINVFYAMEGGSENEDDYDWVEINGTRYPIAKNAENIIPNGDFTDGTNGWTNAANGGALSGNWSVDATSYAQSGNSISTSNGDNGGASEHTVRTFFEVEPGKQYYAAYGVYNAGTAATAPQSNSGMRALIATEGYGFGDPKTCGATLYGANEWGGISSWTTNGNANSDFYINGSMPTRDDGIYQPGYNTVETVITVPDTAEEPYIMISFGAWTTTTSALHYGDFRIYEVATMGTVMASRVTINLNGEETESILVAKDGQLPDLSAEYPGCVIDASNVDTSVPNGGVVYISDPTAVSMITIGESSAVLSAVGETISGVMVVAQYDSDGQLVDVVTAPVTVADGESSELAFTAASDAVEVKAMVVESLGNIRPLLRSASAEI